MFDYVDDPLFINGELNKENSTVTSHSTHNTIHILKTQKTKHMKYFSIRLVVKDTSTLDSVINCVNLGNLLWFQRTSAL